MNINSIKKRTIRNIKKRSIRLNGKIVTQYYAHLPPRKDGFSPRMVSSSRERLEERLDEYFEKYESFGSLATELNSVLFYDMLEAKRILANAGVNESISYAIQNYVKMLDVVKLDGGKTVQDVFAIYAAEKKKSVSNVEMKTLNTHVGRFASFCGNRAIRDVDNETVKVYMRGFEILSPRSYNNTLTYLKSFFNWCCNPEHQYMIKNPAKYFTTKTIMWKEPVYMPVAIARQMFRRLEEEKNYAVLARMVLWFFCGIRQAEIDRIAEGDDGGTVDTKENVVRIKKPKGYTKGIAARAFSMQENAIRWIERYDLMTHLREDSNRRKTWIFLQNLKRECKDLDIKDNNLGRHSFITYHVAKFKEPEKTQALCGTSKAMLANHYRGLASEADGIAYFNILPEL